MIALKNICKSFDNKVVLNNFSHSFESGITILMGKSGSGKTTLVNIILGLLVPDSGEIEYNIGGKTILKDIQFGAVFQEDRLFESFTALENIAAINDKNAYTFLKKVNLENELKKKVYNLSGGMKRRLSLARALAVNPDYLILDEPFAGLDKKTKQQIMDLVIDYSKTIPAIIVLHDLQDAKYFGGTIVHLKDYAPPNAAEGNS
ncbi:MAG: ATP-binding cassette domain-containing protein [Firmicutes bacterium]|nr:ATP-binding cassette domain-containing protein [Bacillota bacterium]